MLCSISDDTETIGKMVSYGADVNAENTMHDRPIHYAAVSNHLSAVRFLIENGAGIDARGSLGKTPLMIAAGEGFLEMVELLLSKGADFNAVTAFGENALFYAESARSAGCEVAELLIKAGIDINCQSKNGTCLNRALLDHKTGFAGLLVKNGALVRKERLFEAVQENQLEVIKVLHEIGADMDPPDEKNRTPLMFALERNNIIAARLLVECGADQGRLDMNAAERLAGTPVLDPRNNTADRSNSKNPIITMDMHDLAAFFRLLFGKLHTRDPYRLSSAFSAKCRKCGKKITNKSILESAGVSMYSSVNADLLECHAMHCSACGHRYAAVEIKTIRR